MVLMLERHLAMVRMASHRTAGNVSIVMCNYGNDKLIFPSKIVPDSVNKACTGITTTISITITFIHLMNLL